MADPAGSAGTPDTRGPLRYIWWLIVSQRRRVLAGSLLGSGWMVGLMVPPYLLSRAIDDGLAPGRSSTLLGWTAVLLGVGVVNAWLAIMRHRVMDGGRLTELGSHDELVAAGGTYAALWRSWHGGEAAPV